MFTKACAAIAFGCAYTLIAFVLAAMMAGSGQMPTAVACTSWGIGVLLAGFIGWTIQGEVDRGL